MTASMVFAFLVAPRLYSPSSSSAPTIATSLRMTANLPDGSGYWLVGADGGVFTFGGAPFYGSLPGEGIHVRDIVGIVATPSGRGYWLMGANLAVYPFGDAKSYGNEEGKAVSAPIVGGAPYPQSPGSPTTTAPTTTVPAGQSYSVFENNAGAFVPWDGGATIVSLRIDPSFSGNLLVQASGSLQQSQIPIPRNAVIYCYALLDGHLINKAYSVTGYAPTALAVTAGSLVSAGPHTVSIKCNGVRFPIVAVLLNAFALVTSSSAS